MVDRLFLFITYILAFIASLLFATYAIIIALSPVIGIVETWFLVAFIYALCGALLFLIAQKPTRGTQEKATPWAPFIPIAERGLHSLLRIIQNNPLIFMSLAAVAIALLARKEDESS
ncbi:MAG: hypothetical protein R3E60_03340 [Alphaproteobacteria bacterium]